VNVSQHLPVKLFKQLRDSFEFRRTIASFGSDLTSHFREAG